MANMLTDTEKLLAYAREVKEMLDLQKEYFKVAKRSLDPVRCFLAFSAEFTKSKEHESRVRKLTEKVLSPQTTLL